MTLRASMARQSRSVRSGQHYLTKLCICRYDNINLRKKNKKKVLNNY